MNNNDDYNNFSRVENRRKHRGHKTVAIVLITILVVIGLSALVFGMISSPSNDNKSVDSTSTSTSSSSTMESSKSQKSESSSSDESSSMSSSSISSSSSMNNTNSSSKEQTNGGNSQTQSTTNQDTNNSGYAVIGQDGMNDLYRVAKRYGTSIQDLMKLNGITDSNKVTVGQKIKVK